MVLGVNLSKLYNVATVSRGVFYVVAFSYEAFDVATEWHRGVSSEAFCVATDVATEWHVGASSGVFYVATEWHRGVFSRASY